MGPENGWGGEKTRTVKSVPSEKIPGPAAKEPNDPMFPKGNRPNCNGGHHREWYQIGNSGRFWQFVPGADLGGKISKGIRRMGFPKLRRGRGRTMWLGQVTFGSRDKQLWGLGVLVWVKW